MTTTTTALQTVDKTAALAPADLMRSSMGIDALVERKRLLGEAMGKVLRPEVHYQVIPGTQNDKPSLNKAGAECLATLFGIEGRLEVRRDDLPNGHREYTVTCTMFQIGTELRLGSALGSCSTMESRYRWRRGGGDRKCPECGVAAIFTSKKADEPGFYCWAKKNGCGAKFGPKDARITSQELGRVENPDIADVYNTVLKMAEKRAIVSATLRVCGASDVLTQDLEDLEHDDEPAPRRMESRHDRAPDRGVDDAEYADQRTAPEPDEVALEREWQMIRAAMLELAYREQLAEVIAPRFNKLPKGTRARAAAFDMYKQLERDLPSRPGTKSQPD